MPALLLVLPFFGCVMGTFRLPALLRLCSQPVPRTLWLYASSGYIFFLFLGSDRTGRAVAYPLGSHSPAVSVASSLASCSAWVILCQPLSCLNPGRLQGFPWLFPGEGAKGSINTSLALFYCPKGARRSLICASPWSWCSAPGSDAQTHGLGSCWVTLGTALALLASVPGAPVPLLCPSCPQIAPKAALPQV